MSLTALLFILAFVSGCVLALVRHPIFGLLTYLAAFYLHPPSRWWGQGVLLDVRWALIAAAVTLIALAMRQGTGRSAPLYRSGAFWAFIAFVAWVAVQLFWALDRDAHIELLTIYLKFVLVIVMVCKAIETMDHLRWFLWAHVLGCFYLGWLALTSFGGGRLDGVGGPGINEANAAALQLTTGVMVAASLFLVGKIRTKATLLALIPVIVNGLVTTVSRSGFLAVGIGGLVYNFFTPAKYRVRVGALSILAVVLFGLLAHESYWERIATITYKGQEVEGVDTGGGRLEIIGAQWRMFEGRPLGCGHMCTTVLSPSYIDLRYLSGGVDRASHNTFMTMLVDHGVIGGVFYVLMLGWVAVTLRTLARRLEGKDEFLLGMLPAIAAVFAAITIGDMFAQYPKFEARIWFISVLIVLQQLSYGKNIAGQSA